MSTIEIQCGEHRGTVIAKSPAAAWRKIVGDDVEGGFALLARYRECLPAARGRKHRAGWGPWFYIAPHILDVGGGGTNKPLTRRQP